jgi:hypothetical protein
LIIGKIIVLLFVIIFLIGCNDLTDSDRLIGTWEWKEGLQENTFIFSQNGSFYSNYIHHATNETHKGWGEFEFKDNQLYLYTSHGLGGQIDSQYYDYIFSEDDTKLTLSSDKYGTIILTKIN